MKHLYILLYLPILFFACSDGNQSSHTPTPLNTNESKYELVRVDSFQFRRAYHGHEELSGSKLEVFLNRNPEPNDDYSTVGNHPFYSQLIEHKIILDANLNLNQIDTLPNNFEYTFSPEVTFSVKKKNLEYTEELDLPSYELTFNNGNDIVLVDTLGFGFPPDVIFFIRDLNKDGKQEFLTVYRNYIVNGDNFDLDIYELKKN